MLETVAGPDGRELVTTRSGHGDAVVFVHGSSGDLHSWDPVTAELPDRYSVVTYSRSAYPPSRRPPGR